MEKRKTKRANALLVSLRAFSNSYLFYLVQTLIACLFALLGLEKEGVIFFGVAVCLLLIVSDDILPTSLPFFLLCALSTSCYNSFSYFIHYAKYAPVVAAALLFHFIVYFKGFSSGKSVEGICAVSIALLLGGVGNFTLLEYIKGSYYILGLGLGMLVSYYLMKSEFSVYRSYDIKIRFAVIMSLLGFFCVAMIGVGYTKQYLGFSMEVQGGRPFSPNNLATLLMFCMPFPVFLSKYKDIWALGTLLIYGGICLTYSRGGLVFGGVEFLVCLLYWVKIGGNQKQKLIFLAVVGAVAFIPLTLIVISVVKDRFLSGGFIDSTRLKMLQQALERFLENPVVGSGILDDSIAYGEYKKAGTMAWYHMMLPQIFGSMGLVGLLAYLWQGIARGKMIFTQKSAWGFALGISYLGILLMSQVNPGEFCPLPFELLTVLLFILQEERLVKRLPLDSARRKGLWKSTRF